jgi:hypothetical protein
MLSKLSIILLPQWKQYENKALFPHMEQMKFSKETQYCH